MQDNSARPLSASPFEQLEQTSTVEIDRYCENCGYNLRQQAVRRETATGLLMCKCPECGRFEPANRLTTARRGWFGQLVILFWVLWVLVWCGLLVSSVASVTGLAVTTGETRRDWVEIPQQINTTKSYHSNNMVVLRPMQDSDKWFLAFAAISSLLIGGLMTGLTTVFVPHWPRWGYGVLAVAWPAIVFVIVHGLAMPDIYSWRVASDSFRAWHTNCALTVEGLALLGGVAAIWLGRPCGRLTVRLFVPPKRRGPLAYLWLVDGKQPPQSQSASA